MPARWKCLNNEAHVFERATNDFLCTYCKQLGELSMIIAIEPVAPVKPLSSHEKTRFDGDGPQLPRPGLNALEHDGLERGAVERDGVEHGAVKRDGIARDHTGHTESERGGSIRPDIDTPRSDHPGYEQNGFNQTSLDTDRFSDQSDLSNKTRGLRKEVGLSVLVMDASGSMLEPAFEGSPLTRLSLVAKTAAYGVFDLQHMQNNPNAFVSIIIFDDRVRVVFPEGPVSIASLIKRFDADVNKFAQFLEEELGSMKQGTDINAALNEAYWLVSKFMENKLSSIYDSHYSPVQQTILKYGTIDSVSIPNVRVLIYTDGMQYDARQNRTLLPNPFRAHPIVGLNHDVLIGAYFGNANEDGAAQLSSVVSMCPIHNTRQFFLIDSPARIMSLQSLFRMASGASGFCPKCLETSN